MNDRIKYKKNIFHKRYLHSCSRYKTSIRDNWFNYHTANSKSLTWLGKRNKNVNKGNNDRKGELK